MNYQQEFSNFFTLFTSRNREAYTEKNALILKGLLYLCKNTFDGETFSVLWTLVAQELPLSIRRGLHDEFNQTDRVCDEIAGILRRKNPSMLYGGPVDEGIEDIKQKWDSLQAKQKRGIMALAAAGLIVPNAMEIACDIRHYQEPEPRIAYDMYDPAKDTVCVNYWDPNYTESTIIPAKTDENGCVHMSESGMKKLLKMEGFSDHPYFPNDKEETKANAKNRTGNVGATIGYGHVIKETDPSNIKTAQHITRLEAENLYKDDMATFERLLNTDIRTMQNGLSDYSLYSQGFIDAMLSYMYNCGHGGFLGSTVFKAWKNCTVTEYGMLDRNGLEDIYKALSTSKITEKGHNTRRAKEAEMLISEYKEYLDEIKWDNQDTTNDKK